MKVTISTRVALRDEVLTAGAFMEYDGTIGIIIPDGLLRLALDGGFFITPRDSLDEMIRRGGILRALRPGEQIIITVE